jgi:hypothetical protein
MRKPVLVAAAFASLAAVLPTTVATASPPLDVLIEIDTTLGDDGGSGPFVASGSSVDEGLFCAYGASRDVFVRGVGATNQGISLQVVKELECGDGSGSVLLKLQVRIDRKGNNYSWMVIDGIGDYERLNGSGWGSGEFPAPDKVDDVLIGGMHVD